MTLSGVIQTNTNNNVINNYGVITATGGGYAIHIIQGNYNTINLWGHSQINGKISISGASNTNIVNLNFTGLSPATIKIVTPSLQAQGANTGADASSVIFTVRGDTISIDPQ